jgi:hypothetical protein
LAEEELQQLPEFLEQGATAYGFRGEVWTRACVGQVIEEEFGVRYSDFHVGRLLAQLGWTLQKPAEQADRRDEAEITCWCEKTFPELKKAAVEGRTLVFIDETAFYLLPGAVRTYTPRGETPVLHYRYWEHRSAISAITPDGQLYTWTQETSFDGPAIVRFLKHVDRQIPGKLLVIWDAATRSRTTYVTRRTATSTWLNYPGMPRI